MWIQNPNNQAYINLSKYADIRMCPKNPTHIDFYEKPQAESDRGNPDYTIEFETTQERDLFFQMKLNSLLHEHNR